jgi:hypothetical protein
MIGSQWFVPGRRGFGFVRVRLEVRIMEIEAIAT